MDKEEAGLTPSLTPRSLVLVTDASGVAVLGRWLANSMFVYCSRCKGGGGGGGF